MRTRTIAVALTVVAALSVAGCSSGGSHDSTPAAPAATTGSGPATTTPAPSTATAVADDGRVALTAAVRAYSAAYFKPDPAAGYALLSKRCRAKVDAIEYASAVRASVARYGHQTVKTVRVDQLSGDLARVSYTYTVPALNQDGQPWAREAGVWHYDAC